MQLEPADRISVVVRSDTHAMPGRSIRLNGTSCYGPFEDTVSPANFIEKTEAS